MRESRSPARTAGVDRRVGRRGFLAGVVGAGSVVGAVPRVVGGDAEPTADRTGPSDPDSVLMAGTEHETPVYVNEGSASGPTAYVLGGIHGDESPGYRAAAALATLTPEAGTLVVLPRANRVAIRRDAREGEGGDLNRNFPVGEPPTTDLASAVWRSVRRHDPDVVRGGNSRLHAQEAARRTLGARTNALSRSGRRTARTAWRPVAVDRP